MGSHRAFLVFMGRNFRARKEVGLPYPSTSGVRRLFARTGKSSPTLITHSRFETLPIPVGSPVHPSSTSDHMYLVECPCLPPHHSHGAVIQSRMSSRYLQLLCLWSTHCELRLTWNSIMKIQPYQHPSVVHQQPGGQWLCPAVCASFRKATLEISLNDMNRSLSRRLERSGGRALT